MPEKKPSDLREQWDALRRAWEAPWQNEANSTSGLQADDPRFLDYEARLAASDTLKLEAAETVWETRARDLADLLLLAEIAYDHVLRPRRSFPSLPAEGERGERGPAGVRGRLPDPRDCRCGRGPRGRAARKGGQS